MAYERTEENRFEGNIMACDCKDYYGLQIKKFEYSFLDTETMTHPRYSEQF